jgi:hypothetical protein
MDHEPSAPAPERKPWAAPQLTRLGRVEEITQQDKTWGVSDGLTFQGVDIRNVS